MVMVAVSSAPMVTEGSPGSFSTTVNSSNPSSVESLNTRITAVAERDPGVKVRVNTPPAKSCPSEREQEVGITKQEVGSNLTECTYTQVEK